MASDRDIVDSLVASISCAIPVRSRAMFGEFVIYHDGKVVALVCDDRLFVKVTPGTTEAVRDPDELAPPYPGARDHYVIDEGQWQDIDYLAELMVRAAADLPTPKPRKTKR